MNKIQQYTNTLKLANFSVIDTLGKSDLGCTLRTKTDNNIDFVLRVISKNKVITL